MGKAKIFIELLESKIKSLESLNLNCHKLWNEYHHIIALRDEEEMNDKSKKIARHLGDLYAIADNMLKAVDVDALSSELKKDYKKKGYKKVRNFFTIKNTSFAGLADKILNEIPKPVVQPIKFMSKLTHFITALQCDENSEDVNKLNRYLQEVSTELEHLKEEAKQSNESMRAPYLLNCLQKIYSVSENNNKKSSSNFYKCVTKLFTEYAQEKRKAVNKFRRMGNEFFACVRPEDSIDLQTVLKRILAEEGIAKKLKQEVCNDSNVAYFRFSRGDAFINLNEESTSTNPRMGFRPF